MKRLISIFFASVLLSACATNYSYYTKKLEDSPWTGPYQGEENLDMRLSAECLSPGYYGSYAIRVKIDGDSEYRTYICSKYKKP